MAYGLAQLRDDFRKALALPAGEALRRFAGRANRYARRLRRRRRSLRLTEAEFLGALASPAGSLAEFAQRRAAQEPLIPGARCAARIAQILKSREPDSLRPILAAARAVRSDTFDLLGSGARHLGPEIDWHTDFKSGKRWDPGAYSLEIVPTPDQGHDIKVPWELSRLQHLPTLGIASAISADEGFRGAALRQIASFLALNPAYRGVNWNCTMDVAIRATQLLSAEGFLRGAGGEAFWSEYFRSLLAHARFIQDNLEDSGVRGNHYLADVAGLYLCALALPEAAEAPHWRQFSRRALVEEIHRQVRSDGVDFEASTSYHAFATEMFLFPALLGSRKGDPFPADYLRRLEAMLDAVQALIRPDGTLPQIGDNDDGRFLIVSQYHRGRRDWRPLLALGAYLFRRDAWLALSGEAWVEGAWVLGEEFLAWAESLRAPRSPRPLSSRAFPESGLYQLAAGSIQMVVDAGDVGQGGNGGHAHNDTLSFDLHAFGREVLPDRGTGEYTASLATRNRFRSTRSHNTLRVDEEEINPLPQAAFHLPPADDPAALRWRSGSRSTYLSAEHRGYVRLSDPLLHRRSFLFQHREGTFLIEDRLDGAGAHAFEASFHLPPGWNAQVDPEGWVAFEEDGEAGVRLRWLRPPQGARLQVEEDMHSPSYGVQRPARTIRIAWSGAAPQRIRYKLTPFLGGLP